MASFNIKTKDKKTKDLFLTIKLLYFLISYIILYYCQAEISSNKCIQTIIKVQVM